MILEIIIVIILSVIFIWTFFLWIIKEDKIIFGHKSLIPFSNSYNKELTGFPQNIRLEQVVFVGKSGKIGAWLTFPREATRGYILYLHGKSWSRLNYSRTAFYEKITNMGFSMLIIDYRGFGESEGKPSEQGFIEDSITSYYYFLDHIQKMDNSNKPLIIWGHSLGSSIASRVTYQLRVNNALISGLVLECPFYSMYEILRKFKLFTFICSIPVIGKDIHTKYSSYFETYKWVDNIDIPILMMVARNDNKVPLENSLLLRNFVESRNPRLKAIFHEFEPIYGHNDLFKSPEFQDLIEKFFSMITL